jgi:thioredoxin reductase (NADPH)
LWSNGKANRQLDHSVEPLDEGVGMLDVDLLVVGAGPVGLSAAYHAGVRGLRPAIVDSLPQPGGQISALYPEKPIYDVAGLPEVRGRNLVRNLFNQA